MHRDGDERRLLGCGAGEDGEMTKPDWEAFGREIMGAWPMGGVDGFELQDAAVKHGVLRETAYDFKAHGKEDHYDWGLQEGDVYFERNYK